jgi:hypothetical protein
MRKLSRIGGRPHCRRAESSKAVLTYRQIGEIRGPQWGDQPGELLQLQGKQLHRLPHWLRQILDQDFGGQFPPEWCWIDHWGQLGESFIAEPYGLNLSDVLEIEEFCVLYDLDPHISPISQHFPTRTLCIEIRPRLKEALRKPQDQIVP